MKDLNKTRVCLDSLHLNKAVIKNHYPIPTIDDVAAKLTKAKVFAVVFFVCNDVILGFQLTGRYSITKNGYFNVLLIEFRDSLRPKR